ncbi:MAG TPA: GlxA family transcriptional regulator [Acidimicrobiales bacterium]|jgi:transcriptional regulator GlxA family with amidase domain
MTDDATVHTVVILAFDGFQLLDLAGPSDVLRAATLAGVDPPYRLRIATPDGAPARSESGMEIGADIGLEEALRSRDPIDTLLVVGGLGVDQLLKDPTVIDKVARVGARAGRIASVCSGALVLARAGLLDGYQATTHWAYCDRLAELYPAVDVEADRIYVHDRDRWTSAGVTAGIDLFLALVEADHGRELAHTIASWLVMFVRRPGGQAQFSAQLRAQAAPTPAIDEVQRWLPDHLGDDLTVVALARRAGMSTRSFARGFRAETGTTPAAYVESLRVEAARRLLETTELTVAAIARAVGLHRPETLYRTFRRRLGTTPDRYRQHFGLRAS